MPFLNDEDIILNAIKTCPYDFTYSSNELQNNHSFVIRAIKTNNAAFTHMSENIKNKFMKDKQFILNIMVININFFHDVPCKMAKDIDIFLLYVSQNSNENVIKTFISFRLELWRDD